MTATLLQFEMSLLQGNRDWQNLWEIIYSSIFQSYGKGRLKMRWPNIAKFFLGMILMTFPIQGMAQVQAELEVNIECSTACNQSGNIRAVY